MNIRKHFRKNTSEQAGLQASASTTENQLQPSELAPSYPDQISISKAKYEDFQVLKKFCRQEAQNFFTNLPVQEQEASENTLDEEYFD